MQAIRHLLAQRHFALLICAATLLLKLIVPTGYMMASDHGRLTITICSGSASPATMTAMAEMPSMHGDIADHGQSEDHSKAEMPCAFSGLSAAALAAVDPIQLAALLAFVMSVGLYGLATLPPSRRAQLKPPSRGPPANL